MIVVDANVITYLVVESEHTRQAMALAERDRIWISVPLWRFEVTSALVTLVRARAIDEGLAARALLRAVALMAPNERSVDLLAGMRAALRYEISAYDAQYVALAESHGVALVTADRALARKTPFVSVLLADAHRQL